MKYLPYLQKTIYGIFLLVWGVLQGIFLWGSFRTLFDSENIDYGKLEPPWYGDGLFLVITVLFVFWGAKLISLFHKPFTFKRMVLHGLIFIGFFILLMTATYGEATPQALAWMVGLK